MIPLRILRKAYLETGGTRHRGVKSKPHFAEPANMRLGNRKLVTDYAHRRIIDQGARCRLPPGPVDFMAVNKSNRRDRLRADWLQFNTLWNKRTGYENRPLFDFLLTLRSSVARGLGKDRSSKHAGHDKNCSAGSYQRLHRIRLHP